MLVSNPILSGFHPDPSVVRVGNDWYVATSTFEWFPGVEIYHSTDLASWNLIARPLDREDLLDMKGVPNSCGVWAPCLSFSNGLFYLVYSITRTFSETTQDTENYLTWAPTPLGPWSKRVRLHCGGFDASMFHDDDGSKWIVGMRWDSRVERNHFNGIYLQRYDEASQTLIGKAKLIFSGTDIGKTEAPHIYHIGQWYYLLTAEGGTEANHTSTVCRSRWLDHGYEPDPNGSLLTARDAPDCPIQCAGHGCLAQAADGEWFLFHLGARKSLFGGWSVLGRETFVQNIVWRDGWPRLKNGGHWPDTMFETGYTSALAPENKPLDISFDCEKLPLNMSSLRIPADLSLNAHKGWLRLYGHESMISTHEQTMIGTQMDRVPCTFETTVDCDPVHFQQAAGLSLWYYTGNFYALLITWDDALGRCLRIVARDRWKMRLLAPVIKLGSEGTVGLRISADGSNVSFSYSVNNVWKKADTDDAPISILSDEYALLCGEQGFTGCFGVLCCQDQTGERWHADFQKFMMK